MTEKQIWGVARPRIKQYLVEHVDGATAEQLATECRISRTTTHLQLRNLKKLRRVYVDRWLPVPNGKGAGMYLAVWCWGNQADTPRPSNQQ